jgi:hypothetical protein
MLQTMPQVMLEVKLKRATGVSYVGGHEQQAILDNQ